MEKIKLSHSLPFLPAADIPATTEFYQDRLNFEDLWIWHDPPTVIR